MALTSVSAELRAMGCQPPAEPVSTAVASAAPRALAAASSPTTSVFSHAALLHTAAGGMAVDGDTASELDHHGSAGAGAGAATSVPGTNVYSSQPAAGSSISSTGAVATAMLPPAAGRHGVAAAMAIPSAAEAILQEAAAAVRALAQRMKDDAAATSNSAERIASSVSHRDASWAVSIDVFAAASLRNEASLARLLCLLHGYIESAWPQRHAALVLEHPLQLNSSKS